MLKNVLLGMSRTPAVKHAVVAFPLTRRLVERFVAGENLDDCLRVTHALVERGLLVTIDFLGEDTTPRLRPTGSPTPTSNCSTG